MDGIAGESAGSRSGEDTRRRGWFWHWNSVVTQYSPLIGLKGVGLLNSYTVWTDRREESPHRGYAFPSQQREADFYGEDRAELIAINKILVALDLIEIRKEMVLRVDEKGRRWRVPHNFYRVKDHADGSALTIRDVLRVVELADRDATVYRYVRRIFSARFAPIDRDNVWVSILGELESHEVWRRLTARARREEARASERTRAGHASRRAGGEPPVADLPAVPAGVTDIDTSAGGTATPSQTSDDGGNTGLATAVGPSNSGLDRSSPPFVGPVNDAGPTGVAPVNRTYDQEPTTTNDRENETTDNTGDQTKDVSRAHRGQLTETVTEPDRVVTVSMSADGGRGPGDGPGGWPAPEDAPAALLAIRSFEEANARSSTPAERRLLRGVAARFEAAAVAADPSDGSGWAWVALAIDEAVEAGSAYVAPRRIREILSRWERDGLPAAEIRRQPPDATRREVARTRPRVGVSRTTLAEPESNPRPAPGFTVVECGLPNTQVWAAVLDELARDEAVGGANVEAWLRPTVLLGRAADGGLIVGTASEFARRRIASRLIGPLRSAAAAVLGVDLPIDLVVTGDWLRQLDNDPAPPLAQPDELVG
jgi:hypothetical protein